ncbi:phosphatase PAP2 family protein [Leptolyngbya sp. FACHB-321]|uniref:phosphatase PAP2 family protein n=1 Tax=Leptolyngbya sp. FACHB-321 TaxID=2692807 RepID=UPI001689B3F4|nr:phosphatase PAP2 family protein [Leptolyngbya sp. FACHB-321]MBD2034326.1 phosphatase PAP2 family protein [Leptolyngbya sp. FACHB-321]
MEQSKQAQTWAKLQSFGTFLKQWFSKHWRSLLLLLIGVYLPLQIFAVLAVQVWSQDNGFHWDRSLLIAIHANAQAPLDQFATFFTKLGTRWGVFPATVAIMLLLFVRRQWRSLLYLLITLPGCALINTNAKVWLHRVRPHLWEKTYLPQDFSFPSGHAMSSMEFVAVLIILTWGSRWCGAVVALGSLFVLTIGWTRLYLGVHYPSDILAGWLIAIAWAIATSFVLKPRLMTSKTLLNEDSAERIEGN